MFKTYTILKMIYPPTYLLAILLQKDSRWVPNYILFLIIYKSVTTLYKIPFTAREPVYVLFHIIVYYILLRNKWCTKVTYNIKKETSADHLAYTHLL